MASRGYDGPMTHQDYIKRKYLSQSDYEVPKKKKPKNTKVKAPTVTIVDDDVDFRKLPKSHSDEEEIYFGTKEEKPQIAGIVDERPLALRVGEERGSKWKKVGGDDDDGEKEKLNIKETVQQSESKAKTLGGKKAGLSNAKDIRKELEQIKRKNQKAIENMSDEMSGKNAKTVFRDRSTGRIRDMEKEMADKEKEMEEKLLREAEKKAKYDRWSQGVVQREEKMDKLESDLHEMSKPLARYGDDEDLDNLLRNQERLDDPMLNEMRKKRQEEEIAKNPNHKIYPKYSGPPAPPNRFNIQPGYRWDGVDRSNGYEAKVFARKSNQESNQEEAYRWSTQDM
ncbi:hypothetical protein RDWZM_000604 [Blomia tropicalis]|uniref:BUD13 homolog n=1 Tax=Blomia tropicalis TaxID=40697 RepID=A0A9Q0MAK6_BLOTA|nr:hypothetical protein RDWZM_000604 [Blomia tropicalis]